MFQKYLLCGGKRMVALFTFSEKKRSRNVRDLSATESGNSPSGGTRLNWIKKVRPDVL